MAKKAEKSKSAASKVAASDKATASKAIASKKAASKPKRKRKPANGAPSKTALARLKTFVPDIKKADYPHFYALNPRQQQFVANYLAGPDRFKLVQSYLAAGYKSKSGAYACAYNIFGQDKVQAAIAELVRAGLQSVGLTPEFIKDKIGQMLSGADIADFEPFIKGEKTLQELRDEGVNTAALHGAAIKSGKFGDNYEIQLENQVNVAKLAAEVAGITTKHVEVSHKHTIDLEGMSPEKLRAMEHALRQVEKEAEQELCKSGAIDAGVHGAIDAGIPGAIDAEYELTDGGDNEPATGSGGESGRASRALARTSD